MIGLVEAFLNEVSLKLERSFSNSVFYGLCLQLNAIVESKTANKNISSKQIARIIENYKSEYPLSLNFAGKFERMFHMELPIDEVVLITILISYREAIKSLNPTAAYLKKVS